MPKRIDLSERLRARVQVTGETVTDITRVLGCAYQTAQKLLRGERIAPDTRIALTIKLDALESKARRIAGQIRRQAIARARGETVESQTT